MGQAFRMRVLIWAGCCFSCLGQQSIPDFYKRASRVTWVVENIDRVRPAWEALGMKTSKKYVNIELSGAFRGVPLTIHAWQITGQLGNLTIDMIQPGEGQDNLYNYFHGRHGDGIMSILFEVPTRQALDKEILRMKSRGAGIIQQVLVQFPGDKSQTTYTYFDTEPEGKYVLGLVLGPGGGNSAPETGSATVSHIGPVVRDGDAVSAYWQKLGFPGFRMERAEAYEIGVQRYMQFILEWISPPASPANVFADYLKRRKQEGIHSIGLVAADLAKSVAEYRKLGYGVPEPFRGSAYLRTETIGGVCLRLHTGAH